MMCVSSYCKVHIVARFFWDKDEGGVWNSHKFIALGW